MKFRPNLLSVGFFGCIVWGVVSSGQARNPGFAKQPVIVEYDVEPSWPTRPDHIAAEGWVSGLSIDDKDQVFMKFSTDGRVQQVWQIPQGDIGEDKNKPDTSRLKPGEAVGLHCRRFKRQPVCRRDLQ